MLLAIISHTPLWVWPLLGYLLYRGWLARQDRQASIFKVLLLPLILLSLSVNGLIGRFQHDQAVVLAASLLAIVAGAVWAWQRTPRNVVVAAGGASVFVRGSVRPLLMTLCIFVLKYSVGVTHALHPEWLQTGLTAITIAALYGAFAGLSLGRVLRICHLYRLAQMQAAQPAT